MPSDGGVLTHCNAGALATAGYGTALGVIRAAVEQGKKIHVYADETRPFLQGSRLTAWELMKDGIPTTVISDNMAGVMMKQGKVGAIVVGADRIAANGDVANKIGTYTVAILAKEHGIPFYVAAPISTVDLACNDGSGIPIEQRNGKEVTHIAGKQMVYRLKIPHSTSPRRSMWQRSSPRRVWPARPMRNLCAGLRRKKRKRGPSDFKFAFQILDFTFQTLALKRTPKLCNLKSSI
jgi:S-methyl-5-thioribose-1-phosphate isomerase